MKKSYIAAIIIVVVVIVAAIGAYALLSSDDKSEPEYYFYLEAEGEEISELPDNWIKATGDNALVALNNYFNEKEWHIVCDNDFVNTLFEYEFQDGSQPGEYVYWVLYVWNESEGGFVESDTYLSGIVADADNPAYIALVYKSYIYGGTNIPPSVTPDDIPADL